MGKKNTPPRPSPLVATASAKPRLRGNYLATGTEVMMLWGAANPVMPATPNRVTTC